MSTIVEKIPKYVIDLETKPFERWIPIINEFKHLLPSFKKEMRHAEKEYGSFISGVAKEICKTLVVPKELKHEIEGIASVTKEFGINYKDILVANVAYSLEAGCTSSARAGYHFRNMDWDMSSLRNMTIDVEFREKGKPIFRITTWVLFVGVLTGMRIGEYTISLNYRKIGNGSELVTYVQNYVGGFFGSYPIEFLIRQSIQKMSKVEDFLDKLRRKTIMAPCYLVIVSSSSKMYQITRKRNHNVKEREIIAEVVKPSKKKRKKKRKKRKKINEYIVQSNHDHWINRTEEEIKKWADGDVLLETTYERRKTMLEHIQKFDPENMLEDGLQMIMNVEPVFNQGTIYSVVMNPRLNIYESRRHILIRKGNSSDEDDDEEEEEEGESEEEVHKEEESESEESSSSSESSD